MDSLHLPILAVAYPFYSLYFDVVELEVTYPRNPRVFFDVLFVDSFMYFLNLYIYYP